MASPGTAIASTSTVAVIIQAVSPLSGMGAAASAAASAASDATSCAQAGMAAKTAKVAEPVTAETFLRMFILAPLSKRGVVGFAGANPHGLGKLEHEDLAVADGPGLCGLLDHLDHARGEIVAHGHLDLDLRHHACGVFGAAIDFGVTLLTAEALDFGNRHALYAQRREGVAHLVELERFDYGDQ